MVCKKTFFFLMLLLLILARCAPNIPKSEYPVRIERTFNASFDKTWNSVLNIVKQTRGKIITSDKASGLITYNIYGKASESQIFINVYLKALNESNTTMVYFFSKSRIGHLGEIEKDFYENLASALGD